MTKSEIRMNDEVRMTNQVTTPREYDLEERTAQFGEEVIAFAKRVPINEVTRPLIGQLVRAASSIGANYVEADDSDSEEGLPLQGGTVPSRSEGNETLVTNDRGCTEPTLKESARSLWQEAKELNLIFGAIRRKN